MLAKARRWWQDPDGRRDEASNSFAMFVVMLPLILGAFGIGVDMSRNVYLRTTIQNHLDLAVVSGAGTHVSNGTKIDAHAALVQVERVYAVNRAAGPGLMCTGSGARVPGTRVGRCWTTPYPAQVTPTSVKYSVREKSHNVFLTVLGIPNQTYNITSFARVNQNTQ